ncbi:hypothetical protein [uncultured Acetobacteroides sp.]|uniref:hypothetical protein n=1 Tax=uncultured Acetobacteroides sp. TaxID=1760811 RepID=UPI0029F532EF|nr:hypothetical protein [uncultured Acetobacteroides sp.]
MNIDDLKNSFQSLSYNSDENMNVDFTRKVEGIVEKVRKEDHRDRLIIVGAGIMMIVFAVIYSAIGLIEYLENPHGSSWWGYGLYVLSILSILPVFRYKYRKIGRSDYNAPVIQFIADVEKKFAFFPKEYAISMIPFLILADASIVYIYAGNQAPTLQNVLSAQIPIFGGLGLGLLIGAILWYAKKLPILEELRAIKSNLS